MIPINLGAITFLILFIPLFLLLLWNSLTGIRFFYKKYLKKEKVNGSWFLELRYFLGLLLLVIVMITWFSSYGLGYYTHKKMALKKPLTIDGIIFPVGTVGTFSKNKQGMKFSKVSFPSSYNFKGLNIYYIHQTYTGFLEIKLASSQKINGISCDFSKKIEVDNDSTLMNCTLDNNNILSGVALPEGLYIKHYSAETLYMYGYNKNEKSNYEWVIDTSNNHTINNVKYWDVHFELNDKLEILKFKGKVATKFYENKEIRELMKKSGIEFKSEKKKKEEVK